MSHDRDLQQIYQLLFYSDLSTSVLRRDRKDENTFYLGAIPIAVCAYCSVLIIPASNSLEWRFLRKPGTPSLSWSPQHRICVSSELVPNCVSSHTLLPKESLRPHEAISTRPFEQSSGRSFIRSTTRPIMLTTQATISGNNMQRVLLTGSIAQSRCSRLKDQTCLKFCVSFLALV